MTREEAIKYFKRHLDLYCVDGISREAEKMAIKALEQEPKTDTWSIKEVADALEKHGLMEQEPKTGHWIGIDEEPHEDYECNRCGYVCSTFTANIKPHEEYKFCPNCGADMRG